VSHQGVAAARSHVHVDDLLPETFHGCSPASLGDYVRASQACLPKLNFPVFSGEDPQLWKFCCENYFDMYVVESSMWINIMSMHLEGTAAHWFQSVEKRVRQMAWDELCNLIHVCFGWYQHEALIHQLFHIRQVSSVTEYVDQFSSLVDLLAAYEGNVNPLYYAMRSVDGLRDDLKSMVMLHHQTNLDASCALVLVQEEAGDGMRKKDSKRYDSSSYRGPPKWLSLCFLCLFSLSWLSCLVYWCLMISVVQRLLVLTLEKTSCMLLSSIVEPVAYVLITSRNGCLTISVPLQCSFM
jgi:hypothetical protein